MNDAIPIKTACQIVGYGTLEAAVAGAKQHPRQAKATQDGNALSGRRFVGASCDLRQWVLEFSGPIWLHVFANGREVDWRVTAEPPPLDALTEPILFDWERGARSTVNCGELAAARVGAQFWQLWVNEAGFYVYLRGRLILCFCVVQRRDTGDMLLYVFEDD